MPVAPSTRRGFVLGSSALLAGLFMPSMRSGGAAADELAWSDRRGTRWRTSGSDGGGWDADSMGTEG